MKKITSLLIGLATIGLAASIYLTQLEYKIAGKGIQEVSACKVSDYFDCNTALLSPFSKVWIFPISEFGIIYYVILMGALIFTTISPTYRQKTLILLWIGSALASLYSIVLLYISLTTLNAVCLVCGTTYAVNILTFLFFPLAMEGGYAQLKEKFEFNITFALIFLVIVAGATTLGLLAFKSSNPEVHRPKPQIDLAEFQKYLGKYAAQPVSPIEVRTNNPHWGSQSPKVTIVEFSDFQCPFCKLAAFNIKPYLSSYKDNVQFIFKNFPLDNSCNRSLPQPMHQTACLAAKAGVCAAKENKFWEYHDLVFENQKRLSLETLSELAEDLHMNSENFKKCIVSDETDAIVKQDIEEGLKLNIHGTPSIFVNGRPFPHWTIPEVLKLIIEAEISGQVSTLAAQQPPATQPSQ